MEHILDGDYDKVNDSNQLPPPSSEHSERDTPPVLKVLKLSHKRTTQPDIQTQS